MTGFPVGFAVGFAVDLAAGDLEDDSALICACSFFQLEDSSMAMALPVL